MQIPDLCTDVLSHYPVELGKYLALYKTLHQYPELPLFESETAQLVAAHLRALSFVVFTSIGGHGVVGVLRNGSGKTILLRSELDALPIREETGLSYASVKRMFDEKGEQQPVMHACGHDIHMTCLLGAAEILHDSIKHWSGTVIALFQPNEEYVGGAQAMITAGLYEKVPRPDVMLAQHVGSERCGRVGVTPGVILPASINVHVSLVSHGTAANPQDCGDLIAVASFIIGRLQTIAASELNLRKYATLICRRFIADSLFVKPPSNVEMVLELRSADSAIEKQALAAIERMVLSECNAAPGRVQATISSTVRFPITRNDIHSASALQTSFKDYFGETFYVPDMILAGEDFSWLGPDIPYVYWLLGGTSAAAYDEAEKQGRVAELIPFPHSPSFAPDPEATIQSGISAMSLAALTFLDVQEGTFA